MREQIFQRKYYGGFGDTVLETYFKENGQLYREKYISGYWESVTKIEPITTDVVEKAIRVEQDKHINELAKLQEDLKKLLTD